MTEEEFMKKLKLAVIITIVITVIIAGFIFTLSSNNPLGTIMLIAIGIITSLITFPIRKYIKNKGKDIKNNLNDKEDNNGD